MKTNRSIAFILVAMLSLVGAACAQSAEGLSDEELRSELVTVLTEDGIFDSATAECTIDSLFENLDRDSLNQLANAQTEDEVTPEQVAALTDAVNTCVAG